MSTKPAKSPLFLQVQNSLGWLKERSQGLHFLSGVAVGARAFWMSQALGGGVGPFVVLANSFEEGLELFEDLKFYHDKAEIGFFPHWDTLPYDNQSPNKDVVATRLTTLLGVLSGELKLVIATPQSISQKIMPPMSLIEHSFAVKVGSEYERKTLTQKLAEMGYSPVEQVEDKGEFAIRGAILDIYPIQYVDPVRLDFFDDELESIKTFSVESQSSKESLLEISLVPASECLLTPETTRCALKELSGIREGSDKNLYFQVKEQLDQQCTFSGMESLLPIFYEETATLLDYFTEKPTLLYLNHESFLDKSREFGSLVAQEFEYALNEGVPHLQPESLYLLETRQKNVLSDFLQVGMVTELQEGKESNSFHLQTVGNQAVNFESLTLEDAKKSSIQRILEQIIAWRKEGAKVAVAAGSDARADHLKQMFGELDAIPEISANAVAEHQNFWKEDSSSLLIFGSPINQGFRFVDEVGKTKVALLSEEEIFGPKQKKRRVKTSNAESFFSTLGDLKAGDHVVHVEYGVGTYEGLKKIQAGSFETDFLVISYAGGDKVYVPIDKFHLVQKYSGADASKPKLNKLGDKAWTKTKSKVKSEVDDMAEELIKIYAQREAKEGVRFSPDTNMVREFEMGFPYQETHDQEKAIEAVKEDMESARPMDRLICGDVGFGKTEVAMRATLKAIADEYQVGILAPTTILSQQHYENFLERFKDIPVNIALFSRFQTAKEIKEQLIALKEGKIDIAIGTHRLLSKDVIFKKLGLLVVDEEQRFGVRHKETIKQMKSDVENLTLSATPIPRTLHMSLMGIRDISVINTPPMDRRAIRTRLMKLNDYVVTEAVEREIRRGGQIFFIHNRVESIVEVGNYLTSIMPKVRIGIAHGQMSEKHLEDIMHGFIHHEFDLLLATTIVESGLDIPNANTIIINNADQLGLSQLYQLRGRVGRSKQQAYCYLLTAKEKLLTEIAKKRLNILGELNHLGAGFKLANYDLELRGAGNVLGSKQSGHITQVGFELYTQMIQEAIAKLQGEGSDSPVLHRECKLALELPASLPEPYIPSMNQRLDAYKSVSAAKTEEELWVIRENLEDRFGKMPTEAISLFYGMQIKLVCQQASIQAVSRYGLRLDLQFYEDFQPDPEKLFGFLSSQTEAKLLPDNGMSIGLAAEDHLSILNILKDLQGNFAKDAN